MILQDIYHDVYGHQAWQDDDVPGEGPTYKATWTFDDVDVQDHVTN